MNSLIHHIASGQSFFSGVALIVLAAVARFGKARRWSAILGTISACVGLILIAVSSTPLPMGFYVVAGMISLAWLGIEGSTRATLRRPKLLLRCAVIAVWGLGAAMELPFHVSPRVPRLGHPALWIVGDSLGAGTGGEGDTWPKLLAKEHGLVVHDLARVGANVNSAQAQADRVTGPGALVLAEIGGNDVLGDTSPVAFETGLDALLSRLRSGQRTVLLLELPLPPFSNKYGEIQRRLASRHGVLLVPKRVLIGVLTTPGATTDSVHLTAAGHALMAETVWTIVRRAFEP
ncbi:MAG: lysophospholipase L1-like esterase [Planctomycetota bacterium]|nr:lysophospholipase L1-like esterase [Planctomycetota bacterium]